MEVQNFVQFIEKSWLKQTYWHWTYYVAHKFVFIVYSMCMRVVCVSFARVVLRTWTHTEHSSWQICINVYVVCHIGSRWLSCLLWWWLHRLKTCGFMQGKVTWSHIWLRHCGLDVDLLEWRYHCAVYLLCDRCIHRCHKVQKSSCNNPGHAWS